MHGPLRTRTPILAAITLLLGFAPAAGAIEQEGHDRWVPSFAAVGGFNMVGISGSVESYDVDTGDDLRPYASGRDYDVSPILGADLELMTPQFSLPLSPRLFLSAEVGAIFGVERDVAVEGNAIGAEGPEVPIPPGQTLPGVGYPVEAITGLGSRSSTQIDKFYFGAGLGVAVPFEWLDRPMRLKVSAEYMWFKADYKGLVTDAQCLPSGNSTQCITFDTPQPPFPGAPDPPLVPGYTRNITLSDSTTKSYNSIGPGIELEIDTGQMRSFTHSIFVGARAYRIIGDRAARSTTLNDEQSYTDPIGIDDTYDAEWQYKIDRWMYRVVVGLRVGFTGP